MNALNAWLFALIAALATGLGLRVPNSPGEPPPFVITGTVRDGSGAAAAGAQVALYPGGYPGGPKFSQATTDKDGRYELVVDFNKPPFAIIHLQAPRFCIMACDRDRNLAAIVEGGRLPQNLDINLKPGLRLSGSIKDPAGKPLENIPLDLVFQSGNEWLKLRPPPAMTDASGAFTISGLPQGRQYIVINEDTAPGYGTVGISLKPEETGVGEHKLAAFVLKQADRKLAGRVVGPDGKPVGGVKVYVKGDGQPRGNVDDFDPGQGQQTTTDAFGNFSFSRLCEGIVQVTADGMDSEGWSRHGSLRAQGGDANVSILFPINARIWGPDDKFVTISGRVLDPSGAQVPGVRICCTPQNYAVTSDAEGKYSMTWITTGNYGNQLWVHMQDFQRHLALNYEMPETPATQDLHLLPALTLAVTVQDPNGKPITTAQAGDLMTKGGGPRGWWTNPVYAQVDGSNYAAANHDGTPAIADSEGVVQIADLPQRGYYRAVITAPGYGAAAIEAQPEQTNTNLLEFPPIVLKQATLSLAGKVLDAGGTPIPGTWVQLQGKGQAGGRAITDAQGRFMFNSVCPGQVLLVSRLSNAIIPIGGDGYAHAQAGDTNAILQFPINGEPKPTSHYASVYGRVLDPSGAPVAGASISCPPIHSTNRSCGARSAADGTYSVTWISENKPGAGQLAIHVQDFKDHLALSQELFENTPNTDLYLQPALTLSVKVRDEDGKPIPSAQAEDLYSRGDNRTFSFYSTLDRFNYYGATYDGTPAGPDGNGVIKIRDLPQSAYYTFTIRAPGYGVAIMEVTPGAAKTTSFQFPPVVLERANLKLAGMVVDHFGDPVGGIELMMRDFLRPGAGQPDTIATTDAQGRFTFNDACKGPAVLCIIERGPKVYYNCQTDAKGGDTDVLVTFDADK